MKRIIDAIKIFFSSPKCVFYFGLVIALTATVLEVVRGRNTNYFDYQDSTRMFWEGLSPYSLEFAQAHSLYFTYPPVFNVLFAPIFYLPWWLGPFVWNICNYCLFALAIYSLPEKLDKYKHWIFLFLLSVTLQSIFCYQYNIVVAYIYIFAFILLERDKGFLAVLLIMISACTKVYGLSELAILLCYPKMWRNLGYALICGVVLLCLPMLNWNMDNPMGLYSEMFGMIASHHSDAEFIGILFAKGLKPFLLPNYRIVQIIVLLLLAILFFWRKKRWVNFEFRVQALAVLSGYIILFSDLPETHTYIITLPFYAMTFWLRERRTWVDWTLFWLLVVNFCVLPTDILCPAWLHEWVHKTFWLDVYTYFICWLRILWWAVGPQTIDSDTGEKSKMTMKPAFLFLLFMIAPAVSAQNKTQVKSYNVKGVEFRMIRVDGGKYMMGAQDGDVEADADEVRHEVKVATFYIGETEVTQALWTAVMGKNRSKDKGDNLPVEYVTYDMCLDFISKLNALTGEKFRLPTEAEWEYAARGGRKSKGYIYSGGNDINEVAHTLANTPTRHHKPVATLKPNELGLYDMSGSVWEWCSDWYSKMPGGKKSSNFHVIRGGGHDCSPKYCRVTNRFMYDQRRRRDLVGLRLAR